VRFACFVYALPALLMGSAALAQTPPAGPLLGTVAHSVARSPSTTDETWCSVDRGTSLFQRSGSGIARIAFPGVSYSLQQTIPNTDFPVPIHYTLAGRARLSFTTASSGKVLFDFVNAYPKTISQPTFTGYAQNYSSTTGVLSVAFTINFPSCNLRVVATYRI
jgi:hypothetical protein